MVGHWHFMDRETFEVETHRFATLRAMIHVKAARIATGKEDPAVIFQTNSPRDCRWCREGRLERAGIATGR